MLAAFQIKVPQVSFFPSYKRVWHCNAIPSHGKLSCLYITSGWKLYLSQSVKMTSYCQHEMFCCAGWWQLKQHWALEVLRSFFDCLGNCLDCEISGQEPSSVLLSHHKILTFLIFVDVSEEKWRWLNFLSLCVIKQEKKDTSGSGISSYFFASSVLNNSFSTFTLEFDRWLQCDCKPSYSLMKQYLKKKLLVSVR